MGSSSFSFSKAEINGGHKGIFGPSYGVQALYAARTEFRSVVRFVGPSKFVTPEYRAQVQGVLESIRLELAAYRSQLEIQTGVSRLGLDAMLAEVFVGHLPTSGVVGWPLPKIDLKLEDGTEIVYSEGKTWNQDAYDAKMRAVALTFRNLSMLVEGDMPAEGIEIQQPALSVNGKRAEKMVVSPDYGTGFSSLDRFVIYGTDWGTAYEMYRPGLVALVVLGGGPISYDEAITSNTLGKRVFCISPDILPQEHKPGLLSASARLVKEKGFPGFDPLGIAKGIVEELGRADPYRALL